jgi:hypothetical protein
MTELTFTNNISNIMTAMSHNTNCILQILLNSRIILLIACMLIIIGYLLMSGDGTTEQAFNPDVFSTRRIVVAPMLCLAGYLLVVVGILRRK